MTYLLVNIGAVLVPLIFSFHKKLNFYENWKPFWKSTFITSGIFISWDIIYTYIGVWEFNQEHLIGVNLFNLPIEEYLFFICIPYASVFTYHCLGILINKDYFSNYVSKISTLMVITFLLVGIITIPKLYTSVTFILLALTIFTLQWILKVSWLSRFYFSYLIILFPFFIVNGILTGWLLTNPVVVYNDLENLNIRCNTIPIEDVFYGMLLLITNIGFYEFFKSKHKK
tara:strand:+ start:366 stop:1049 length:684 start_codon:yes stop_codon:yes gene_type:complete